LCDEEQKKKKKHQKKGIIDNKTQRSIFFYEHTTLFVSLAFARRRRPNYFLLTPSIDNTLCVSMFYL